MQRIRRSIGLVLAILLCQAVGPAADLAAAVVSEPSVAQRVVPAIPQAGLSGMMMTYGIRFADAYFAAEGDNWGLAQYELQEMRKLAKTGDVAAPDLAPRLKIFEDSYLTPLEDAVVAKEWSKFADLYRHAVDGCNGCHNTTGRGFIQYSRPARPIDDYLDFTLGSEPKIEHGIK